MIINAKYKINDDYVVGDDRNIYRLPFESNGKKRKLRKLKEYRGGFFLKGEWIEKSKIQYKEIEPYELINNEKTPF